MAENIITGLDNCNQMFDNKKILITGALGFLGFNFLNYFSELNNSKILNNPCTVFAWDNFIRGTPYWINRFKGNKNIIISKKDIINDYKFPKVDFIIHAASIASPTFFREYPIETIESNVLGVKHLLDYSKEQDIKSFLFFSSSEIYGDPDQKNIPTTEEYRGNVSCTGPRACYDESKRLGETLCVNYWMSHNVPVKIARPFNNYGPGMSLHDRRVIPDFFRDTFQNQDITLLSDGKATRTFCYASDAVEGYLRILLSDHNGESFNIGTDNPNVTMAELAEIVIKISKKSLKIHFGNSNDKNYLTDCPQNRCPSINKAKKMINYSPSVGLFEGLEQMYNYYKNEYKENS